MTRYPRRLYYLMRFAGLLLTLMGDAGRFLLLCLRPSPALAAENLFLRKQLALYQEHHTTPQRATNATRLVLVWLGRWFDWRQVIAIVQPATFLRWHRQGFRLFWRWQSRPGRPRIPAELQALIRQIAQDNPTWAGLSTSSLLDELPERRPMTVILVSGAWRQFCCATA